MMKKLILILAALVGLVGSASAETSYIGRAETVESQYAHRAHGLLLVSDVFKKVVVQDYYIVSNDQLGTLHYTAYVCDKRGAISKEVVLLYTKYMKLVDVFPANLELNYEVAELTKKYGATVTYSNGYYYVNIRKGKTFDTFVFLRK